MLSKRAAFLTGRRGENGQQGVGRDQGRAPRGWQGPRRESQGLGAPREAVPGTHCPSEGTDCAPCHHVPPRTAESPAVTSPCWGPFAGDASLQTKHFCCSLTFHFQSAPSQFHGDRAWTQGITSAHLNSALFLACTNKKLKGSAFICLKATISYETSLALRVLCVSMPLPINILLPAEMEKIGAAPRQVILLQRFLSK